MNKHRLISVLGWEERFSLGLNNAISTYNISSLDLFIYEEYREVTSNQYQAAIDISSVTDCTLTAHIIQYTNPVQAWKYLQSWVKNTIEIGEEVWLDISTMPRETIWSLLFFFTKKDCIVHYIYWPPRSYTGQWLCKQPEKPRLLYKHSGITDIDKETALVILTGYDEERTAQLVFHYQPQLTMLLVQIGDQFNNLSRNNEIKHKDRCKGTTQLISFEIDVYNKKNGISRLREVVFPLLSQYNVIISSLGPKLSAISVYELYREFPEIALTYVPTRLYNLDYSEGISEAITGTLSNDFVMATK